MVVVEDTVVIEGTVERDVTGEGDSAVKVGALAVGPTAVVVVEAMAVGELGRQPTARNITIATVAIASIRPWAMVLHWQTGARAGRAQGHIRGEIDHTSRPVSVEGRCQGLESGRSVVSTKEWCLSALVKKPERLAVCRNHRSGPPLGARKEFCDCDHRGVHAFCALCGSGASGRRSAPPTAALAVTGLC